MSDMTYTLPQLSAKMNGFYTRQHLAYMSASGKIPNAFKVGNRWIFEVDRALAAWIRRNLIRKIELDKKAGKLRRRPASRRFLKSGEVAKLSGLGVRQVERLSSSTLAEWHYMSPGRHHLFWDTVNLRRWCLRYRRDRASRRMAGNVKLGGPSLGGELELMLHQIIAFARRSPEMIHPNSRQQLQSLAKQLAAIF